MLNKLPGKVFALLKQDSKTIAEDLKSLVKYLYSKFCYYFKLLKTPKTLWLHIKLGAKVRFQKAKQFVLGIPYYVKHIPHHVKVFIGKVKIFVPQIPAKLKTFAQKLKGSSRTRTRFAGSLLFTLIAVTLFRFFFLSGAEAAWFDDHWTFRRKMTITNNGSSTSDKKVMFDIDTASIIAEGKMQADGGDIRVTDQRGKLLPYYYDDEGGLTGTAAEEILRDGSGPYAIDDAGDPGTLPGSARQIVQTSTGTLYAFVNDGGSCEVWMSVTGNSWAEQDSANNPACASDTYISVAVGTADTLHILYMANSSTFSFALFIISPLISISFNMTILALSLTEASAGVMMSLVA